MNLTDVGQTGRVCRRFSAAFLLALLCASCSTMTDNFAQFSYPADIDLQDGGELQSTMHELAAALQQLDMLLTTGHDGNTNQQQEVISALGNIASIAQRARASESGSTHTFLQEGLNSFVSDLREANRLAMQSPPRYYMAGRVSGACVNCHRSLTNR